MKKAQWIRTLPCAICSAPPPCEASHVRTAANSGTGIKPSDNYIIPACKKCHFLETTRGRSYTLLNVLGIKKDREASKYHYLDIADNYQKKWLDYEIKSQ